MDSESGKNEDKNKQGRSSRMLSYIFGSYTPPGFITAIAEAVREKRLRSIFRSGRTRFSDFTGRHRKAVAVITAAALLAGGGGAGFRIWKSFQTEPILVTAFIEAPANSGREDGLRAPAAVSFDKPASPDTLLADPSELISVSPDVSGEWVWENPMRLVFTPDEAWPLSTEFEAVFPRDFMGKGTSLTESRLEFSTQGLFLYLTSLEFYINPTDSSDKRVTAGIESNYPVNTENLAGFVKLKPDMESSSGSLEKKAYNFEINPAKDDFGFYIVSEKLGIPASNIEMYLTIDKGITAKAGGKPYPSGISESVTIPGISSYVRIDGIEHSLVMNDRQRYEQILSFITRGDLHESQISDRLEMRLLPVDKPAVQGYREVKNYRWYSPDDVTNEILKLSTVIKPKLIPAEREISSVHSFRFKADPGRYVFLRIPAGTMFFGGYVLPEEWKAVFQVKDYPRELKFASEGAILPLSGSRRLGITSRGIDGIECRISRIRPDDINHLISQSNGDIRRINFSNYRFNEYNISEQYMEELSSGTGSDPNSLAFVPLDLSAYLRTIPDKNLRYGIFYIRINGKGNMSRYSDRRMVVVTDLGIIVKNADNGTKDIFIQSAADGMPVAGAAVEILGLNGNPVYSAATDRGGRVSVPKLDDLKEGHRPEVIRVTNGNDLSFMPYDQTGRRLDYSNFDTGGIYGAQDPDKLSAYLFSDRGIYRPGDLFNIGMIVKAGNWNKQISGTPLEYKVTDPRGNTVLTRQINLPESGFAGFDYRTESFSPTGTYRISLYVIDKEEERIHIGSTSVKVEEFRPDSMVLSATFSPLPPAEGWVKPEGLKANISLRNLFGSPASGNEIKAAVSLFPGYGSFSSYPGFSFFDPLRKDNRYERNLGQFRTDADGTLGLPVDLSDFEAGTYRLRLSVEAFEKGSGRAITTQETILVSPMDSLIGMKPDGDLSYIARNSVRKIAFIAVDPSAQKTTAEGLTLRIEAIKYISSLVRQPNGLFRYQSVEKAETVRETPFSISRSGSEFSIPTDTAGEYRLALTDVNGTEIQSFRYTIAGKANLQRSLERNAEIELRLNKEDYRTGEPVEVFIKAPYGGAGLLTIERDRIYSYKWFNLPEGSGTVSITVPEGLEGNGYINVCMTRSMKSSEIYMSPFCYGAVPFSVSLENRTNRINIETPALARAGEPFPITVSTSQPGSTVVFAVDEGILRVAEYSTPDPLSFFFRKRALEVGTSQLLDMLLPEFSILKSAGAMGGGEGADLIARNINPFRRRDSVPVAFWSGIIETGREKQTLYYDVPEYFNGTLRVMAVTVSQGRLGAAEKSAVVRNPFIIQPNVPASAAPGDVIDVSVTVTNMKSGSGQQVPLTLKAEPSDHLSLEDSLPAEFSLDEGLDRTVQMKFRINDLPGAAEIRFSVEGAGDRAALTSTLSVRPPSPYRSTLETGILRNSSDKVELPRQLYDDFAERKIHISYLPLGMMKGLAFYLDAYPYGCSEQITSAAFPALYPEMLKGASGKEAANKVNNVISVLQSRQKDDGSFGLWTSMSETDNFITCYIMHFLTEAGSRGYYVPPEMFARGLMHLYQSVQSEPEDFRSLTDSAYAVYLLALNEIIPASQIEQLLGRLSRSSSEGWQEGFCGLYMAGTYDLLKQDSEAAALIRKAGRQIRRNEKDHLRSQLSYSATYLYMVSRHFPERMKTVSPDLLTDIAESLSRMNYSTVSAALCLMASEYYMKSAPVIAAKGFEIYELDDQNGRTALIPETGDLMSVEYSSKAGAVEIKNKDSLPLFYQVVSAGFDRKTPVPAADSMEITRELLDLDGNPVSSAAAGDRLTARIRFKLKGDDQTLERFGHTPFVIVDMIPAGLEIDIDSVRSPSLNNGFYLEHSEAREDRALFFVRPGQDLGELEYSLRAVNPGSFSVPPVYTEAMYEPGTWTIRESGRIEITD